MSGLQYLKPRYRRPVWYGPYFQPDDHARIPRAWCCRCGMEVFAKESVLCVRCERRSYDVTENPLSL